MTTLTPVEFCREFAISPRQFRHHRLTGRLQTVIEITDARSTSSWKPRAGWRRRTAFGSASIRRHRQVPVHLHRRQVRGHLGFAHDPVRLCWRAIP